jgi:uncharacterized protein (TIGR03437 family)
VFTIRTLLLAAVCLGCVRAAARPVRPLYFEDRQNGVFESHAAGEAIRIYADRVEIGDITLRFAHASKQARVEGLGTPAPSTYLLRGRTLSFRQYPKARIRNLYPGIDAVFYGTAGRLEYDLKLAAGARASQVRVAIEGAREVRVNGDGLIIRTRLGEMRQLAPRIFENDHGIRRAIEGRYVLRAGNEVGFELRNYDRAMQVTLDPVVEYEKYFGGSAVDTGGPVATDAEGNVYVTGATDSVDFPSTSGRLGTRVIAPLIAYSNAGKTAMPLPVATQTSVAAIGGTEDGKVLYVATPDGIFVSGDSGASFTPCAAIPNPSTDIGLTVQAISVDQIDPSRLYVATNVGLFAGTYACQQWGEIDAGMIATGDGTVNVASVEVSQTDPTTLYAAVSPYPFSDQPSNIYSSTDAGSTWQQLNPSYPGEPAVGFPPLSFVVFTLGPNGSDLYVVDGNGNLFKSTDGGMTWQQLAGKLYGSQSITFDPSNASTIYVLDNFGVQRSTDGGETFTTISPPFSPGVTAVGFAIDGSGALYIATAAPAIEVSTNGGTNWTMLPPRPNPHVLVGLGGQVFAGVSSPAIPFVTKWSADGSQLLYSTFFGGSYIDAIAAIAVDAQGEAIIAGNTFSADFPVTENISAASPAGFSSGFVVKLSADGTHAVYASILGASKGVTVNGLAIDASGASYITGASPSPDFPTTSNVLQPKPPGSTCQRVAGVFDYAPSMGTNAFVSKLSADASALTYSTFLSGSCGSEGQGITVDAAGEAVVVGATNSPDFPVSTGAYQSQFPGGATASTTYPNPVNFGFVSKFSAAGDKLIASSFIGGGFQTGANAVTLDTAGDAYITGFTWGITPGATPGAYQPKVNYACFILGIGPPTPPGGGADAFVLKLDPAFSTAQALTYLGGICDDAGESILLQPSGNIWVGGSPSSGFPLVTPFEISGGGGGFVSEFNPDVSQLLFSSYSDGGYLAQDPGGAIYVAGSGQEIPATAKTPPGATDVSLTKINPESAPPVVIDSIGPSTANEQVTNLPGLSGTTIAPGELIAITGTNLGPSSTVNAQLDSTGRLPFQVDGVSVSFNGYLAPVISVQANTIVCFAPFEISGQTNVTVTANGQSSTPVRVLAAPSAPYVLTIINQDGTLNSANHPAPQGSVVSFYVTGLGVTSPLSQDGSVSMPPLPAPVMPVNVAFNGTYVHPQFEGAAYGLVAGITQVNVQIPVATYSSNPVTAVVGGPAVQIYVGQ